MADCENPDTFIKKHCGAMKTIYLLPVLLLLCLNCQKKTATKPEETLQSVASFPVGAAISYGKTKDSINYRNTVAREHNSITVENAMKFHNIHPNEKTYTFEQADYLADFALSQKKRLHGHTLVWYQSSTAWLRNFKGNTAAWDSLMKTHIQTVVTHYKGKVTGWDVVNEAFRDDDASLRLEDRNPSETSDDGCIWARQVGRDYIAKAFQYAHEADPDALLFYNDYGHEMDWGKKKIKPVLDMVADFKQRNIPIHGLGLQMHMDINTTDANIINALREFAKTGLKIHISELDISVNPDNKPDFVFTDELKQKQADKFKFVAEKYKELVPESQRYGITHWNVSDADTWIRSFFKRRDYPLLYDERYQKKKAYFSFVEGLKK